MAINNTVILEGNLGDDTKLIETDGKKFVSARMATRNSYKDESGEWQQQEKADWHNLLAFSPRAIELLKSVAKSARVKVTGTLSYKPYEVTENNKTFNKYEASIIVRDLELAPLFKKNKANQESEIEAEEGAAE